MESQQSNMTQTDGGRAARAAASQPLISVIILNYNGAKWLERCLASVRQQTILGQIEIIVADNRSSDGSDLLAENLVRDWPNGRCLQNGSNLGFCEGNNRGAKVARGRFLFFLNNAAWLEPDKEEDARRSSSGTLRATLDS